MYLRAHTDRASAYWWGWGAALFSTVLLLVLAALPPFIGEAPRLILMEAFAKVCHQLPERSPHMAGVQLAACHRCFGIYAGLLVGVLAFPFMRSSQEMMLRKRAGWLLVVAGLPAAVDWSGDVLGFWTNVPISRVLTGGIFGVAAGLLLARALARMHGSSQAEGSERRRSASSAPEAASQMQPL